jgi:uncharacterized cupin superfamily protein
MIMTRTARKAIGALAALLVAATASAQEQKIIRFEPNGPAGVGLKGNERSTAKSHTYYKSATNERMTAGVWTSPDYSGPMHVQPFTEFIYLLEGSVTFQAKDGREETFTAGDAVMIPRGTEFSWKKTNNLREYYVIFDREAPGMPAPQGTPTFYKLNKEGPGAKGLKGEGRTKSATFFTGGDKSSVGVWETAPHAAADFGRETQYAELMVFLSGTVTLSTPQGQKEVFKAGEVALVPKGIRYKWESDTVRKYWVIFDRNPAPAAAPSAASN